MLTNEQADLLQRAIEIAVTGHRSQRQKDGSPYVLHPLTLMHRVHDVEAKMAAVLHDVVEDTEFTIEDVAAEGFSAAVIDALRLLTHDDGSDYFDYIDRIATNPLATKVKLADLEHNMTVTRIVELKQRDLDRLAKYHRAHTILTNSRGRAETQPSIGSTAESR